MLNWPDREEGGISSVGRAPALHAGSHGFDFRILHVEFRFAKIRVSHDGWAVQWAAVGGETHGQTPQNKHHRTEVESL